MKFSIITIANQWINLMEFSVLPLHNNPEYLQSCCDLINSEWKRSDTARLRSLEASCDHLPVSLILLKHKQLIGHLKLSPIPSISDGCFVESVVITKNERGKGYGKLLMKHAEEYSRNYLNLNVVYLSTKGQEEFYRKLGYNECLPVSIYGGCSSTVKLGQTDKVGNWNNKKSEFSNSPKAPPMPTPLLGNNTLNSKTYMKKHL
ncbi:hypothetical protein ABEB36_007210 [Hypothenemus hampei]|uniref:N-acetyltransferase domain-containing protein n=1 Tax=Hypothenemus hampei TaxID=57062 RepID=A0ABD1ETQ3_HYPHA